MINIVNTMLLPDKSSVREKLNNNSISLKEIEEIEEKDFDLTESYTTDNIVAYQAMVSNYECSGIPSKTSFVEIMPISNKDYVYGNFNNKVPDNNFKWQSIVYTVNKTREIPFLLYLLKNGDNEYMFIDTINGKEKSVEILLSFLSQSIGLKLQYSGFITYDNVNYLYFEYADVYKELHGYTWSLVSEIINNEKMYGIKINNSIKNLLLNNTEIVNIYNIEKTSICEQPCVCYFLIDKRNGHQLYSGDYNTLSSIILNMEESDKTHYCMSRCALFAGIIKCNTDILNNINKLNYYDTDGYNSVYNLYMPNVNEIFLFIKMNNNKNFVELSRFYF